MKVESNRHNPPRAGVEVPLNCAPFRLCGPGELPPRTRSMSAPEGVGDRLRAVAFAELQAREAFDWAARTFREASHDLRGAWLALARAEDKHLGWLLSRMAELGVQADERPVSLDLWRTLTACTSAREFAVFMAAAEERGRVAGERFREGIRAVDPVTAELFGKIAEEEISHIELAKRHFDFDPSLRAEQQVGRQRPLKDGHGAPMNRESGQQEQHDYRSTNRIPS
ncbi:MAG TPA: ferritin-like domain-containing protein [Bdellovibrionota bacterium]|nr:ferritin-like domain-containing protein [Bdellovibrionota bacterium]